MSAACCLIARVHRNRTITPADKVRAPDLEGCRRAFTSPVSAFECAFWDGTPGLCTRRPDRIPLDRARWVWQTGRLVPDDPRRSSSEAPALGPVLSYALRSLPAANDGFVFSLACQHAHYVFESRQCSPSIENYANHIIDIGSWGWLLLDSFSK